jgi:hypothetical protein
VLAIFTNRSMLVSSYSLSPLTHHQALPPEVVRVSGTGVVLNESKEDARRLRAA